MHFPLLGHPSGVWDLLTRPGTAEAEQVCWDEVIRRHDRRVIVALLARGLAIERAREIAQEAWMRLIQQHRAGKLESLRLPAVAITQATFLALDDMRRERRRGQLGRRGVSTDGGEDTALERRLLAREQLRQIAAVVERASPNAQQVFCLTWGDDAKAPVDVAAELGLSVQRVRQIVCELRRKIRDQLESIHA